MNTIFYGNGINRLSDYNPSWDGLLTGIDGTHLSETIPNTLKYEAIVMNKPYRESDGCLLTSNHNRILTAGGSALVVRGEQTELMVKRRIARELSKLESNDIYNKMLSLPVEQYITTNYDNAISLSLNIKFERVKHNKQEKKYSIRRQYLLGDGKTYWPIHGNIDTPASIMLGYDHYCGALSKIEEYVKGSYDMPDIGNMEPIKERLKDGIRIPLSWIDLFFISDMHILGFGMKYEESDIWWLLNKRKRIKREDGNLIKNRIIFYPDYDIGDMRQILHGFDVEICELDSYDAGVSIKIEKQFINMQRNIGRRKM